MPFHLRAELSIRSCLGKYNLNMREENGDNIDFGKPGKKSLEIKTNDVLNNYVKELNDDVKLSEYNLREKSMLCSSLWAKWLSYLFLERENLARISSAKSKILKTKMSSNKIQDSVLRMKSEDKLSENDENIKKLNVLKEQTQENIDFIERALSIFSNFGF